jgi:hypothetical protein
MTRILSGYPVDEEDNSWMVPQSGPLPLPNEHLAVRLTQYVIRRHMSSPVDTASSYRVGTQLCIDISELKNDRPCGLVVRKIK